MYFHELISSIIHIYRHTTGRSNLNSSGIGSRYKLRATRQYGNYVDEISRLAKGWMLLHTANFTANHGWNRYFHVTKSRRWKASYEKPACFSSGLVKIVLNLDKQMWKNFNLQRIARKTAFNLFFFLLLLPREKLDKILTRSFCLVNVRRFNFDQRISSLFFLFR